MLTQVTRGSITSASELAEQIEQRVEGGELEAGDRLPPIRQLAAHLDLAPNTVAAAIRRLVERGVLVTRGRQGTYVAPSTGFMADPPVPEAAIDLASGNPDPELLPDLGPVLAKVDPTPVVYGAPSVHPSLEAAARRWLAATLADAPMAVVAGALDGVERSLAANLRPGDRVAIEAPGWPAFAGLVRALGLEPVPVEIDDLGFVPERLEAVVEGVEAVIVTTRVQNPTGAAVDETRAGELRQVLGARPDVLVVEDDHAGHISGVPLNVIGPGRRRWVLIQSSSKSFGPDLRTAVLVGDDRTVRRLQSRQGAGAGWVSHLLQQVLAILLDDPSTPARMERTTRIYDQRRVTLLHALAERGVPATGRTGLNVWVPVPDEQAVVASLLQAGYAVRAGEWWRMGTPPAVRVTTARLEPGLAEEVAEVIAETVHGRGSRGRSA